MARNIMSYDEWRNDQITKRGMAFAPHTTPQSYGVYVGLQAARTRLYSAMLPHEDCKMMAIKFLEALIEDWDQRDVSSAA